MKKIIFITMFAMLATPFITSAVSATEKDEAEHVLKQNMESIINTLQNTALTKAQKKEKVLGIVTPVFDFELMAKLAMGKKYWNQLSDNDKEQFTQIFTNRLRQSYVDKLDLYSNEKIVYKPSQLEHKKVYIPTDLVSGEKTISMLYKMYARGADWKIYDVEIQGVSIIKNYRSQISQIMQTGTVKDLFEKMQSEP